MNSKIFWGITALFLFYGFLFCIIYDVARKVGELEKKLKLGESPKGENVVKEKDGEEKK